MLLNKELSLKREIGKYECQDCGREYNKSDLSYKHNNISWPAYFPENGFCDDCGSQNINFIGNENNFEEQYRQYEEKSREILPFYQELFKNALFLRFYEANLPFRRHQDFYFLH